MARVMMVESTSCRRAIHPLSKLCGMHSSKWPKPLQRTRAHTAFVMSTGSPDTMSTCESQEWNPNLRLRVRFTGFFRITRG